MLSLSDIVNVKVGIGRGVFEAPGATVIGGAKLSFEIVMKKLFANGEQGFFYDPNDLSTMYQDAAGTVPVTAAGQPVGLIRDKSSRNNHARQTTSASRPAFRQVPVLGNELSNKTSVTGLAINPSAYDTYLLGGQLTAGKTYKIALRVSNFQGSGYVGFSASDFLGAGASRNGYYEYIKTAIQTREVRLVTGMGATADFSEISVKEVTGYRTDQNYIEYDKIDDKLITTLPAQLTGCTVVRSVPNVGTQILTNQTIPATYNDNTDHCGLIVINRALTATETSQITKLFNKAAGV